jgi:SMC interacting uncharacterized protein involved in chromosome segregation
MLLSTGSIGFLTWVVADSFKNRRSSQAALPSLHKSDVKSIKAAQVKAINSMLKDPALPSEIKASITEITQKVDYLKGNLQHCSAEEKHTVNSVLTNYLPNIVANYLDLPEDIRNSKNETTIKVFNQIQVINERLDAIKENTTARAVAKVDTESDFLHERFGALEKPVELKQITPPKKKAVTATENQQAESPTDLDTRTLQSEVTDTDEINQIFEALFKDKH